MNRIRFFTTSSHPFLFYGLVLFGLTLAGALVLWWILKWNFILAWLVAISPVTLLAFRYDKLIAGSDRLRVPERVLLLLALAGGTPGAILGMWFIGGRHKTSKSPFLITFFIILVLQAVLVGAYVWLQLRG